MAARIKIAARHDIFRLQNPDQLVAAEADLLAVNFHDDVMKVHFVRCAVIKELQPRHAGEAFAILLVVATIGFDEIFDRVEAGQAHGGADFVHLAIDAEMDDTIVAAEPEIFHQPDLRRDFVVVGCDGAAFECIENFGGVETEHFGVTEVADHLAFVGTSERVRGIVDQLDLEMLRQRGEFIDRAGPSPDMHTDDAGDIRRDHFFDDARVEMMCRRIDVAKNRGNLLPLQGVRGGNKRERRHDDFALESEGADGEFKANRRIANGDAMFDAQVILQSAFQFLHACAIVRKPTAIEDLFDTFHETFSIGNVWPADVYLFSERRTAAENSQVVNGAFVGAGCGHIRLAQRCYGANAVRNACGFVLFQRKMVITSRSGHKQELAGYPRELGVFSGQNAKNGYFSGMAKPTPSPPSFRNVLAQRMELVAGGVLTVWCLALHFVYLFHAGPLWRDECGTIAFASMPLGEMWSKLQYDNFPPLFEWIAHMWGLIVSPSDFSYRVLGLVVAIATLIVIWISVGLIGARVPLLALALYALNPLALRVGDSMRPYGLGFALIVLTVGFVWKFTQARSTEWFVAATVAATLAVQCLYQNAFFVATAIGAASIVCLRRKDWKCIGQCFCIGLIALAFLLIHWPNIHKGEAWREIARVPVSQRLLTDAANELLKAPGGFMPWIYVIILSGTIGAGVYAVSKFRQSNVVYALVIFLIAPLLQFVFLTKVGLPPRAWYFLNFLAPMMVCADVVWNSFTPKIRTGRVAVALLIGLLTASVCWSGAQLRQTNVDLIAAKLKSDKKPEDLVLVAPWFNGVSLCRYYPQTNFTTLPPMEEIRIHHYDLMKRSMQSAEPIAGLESQIVGALRGGHKVWLVGSLKFPQPGEKVAQIPPYYTGIGNNDAAYYFSWSGRLGKLVQEHATLGDIVTPAPPAPINPVENLNLIAISGWHD